VYHVFACAYLRPFPVTVLDGSLSPQSQNCANRVNSCDAF
jgi:hypothetical protein